LKKIAYLWKAFWRPTPRFSVGFLTIIGFLAGIIYWGGFNWAIALSNTENFCITCHEMRDNVYETYTKSIHYNNASGVRAICSDCHVPREWQYKMLRKIAASKEIYHKLLGTIDTSEKFEAKRLELAKRVWKTMEENDSRECRNCHQMTAMAMANQSRRARNQHDSAVVGVEDGDTCIDCHKGIAHKSVHLDLEEDADIEEEDDDGGFMM
jgi:cytochrome c-type protein NapC